MLRYERWTNINSNDRKHVFTGGRCPRDRRQPADGGSLSPLTRTAASQVESDLHDLLPARAEPIIPSAAVPFTRTNRSEGPL